MRGYWCLTWSLHVCVCVQMSFVFHRENSVCVGGTENLLNHRLHLHPSTPLTHTHTHTTSLSLIHAGIPQWHLIFHHSLPSIHLSFLDQVSVAQVCEYLSDFQGLVDLLCLHLQLKVVAFRKNLYIHTHISDTTFLCTQENKPFKLLTLFCSLF